MMVNQYGVVVGLLRDQMLILWDSLLTSVALTKTLQHVIKILKGFKCSFLEHFKAKNYK
jgi:hypothetical protein